VRAPLAPHGGMPHAEAVSPSRVPQPEVESWDEDRDRAIW
jgi:hypothetical protein